MWSKWNRRAIPVVALAFCLAVLFGVAAVYGVGDAETRAAPEDPAPAAETPVPVPVPTPPPEPEYEPVLKLRSGDRLHEAYLGGYDDGTIRPDAPLTRAECAQMFYWLLDEEYPERTALKDVGRNQPYCDAMGLLAAYGIINCPGGMARPEAEMTRAEFISALSRFFPGNGGDCEFTDMPSYRSYYREVAKGTGLGWINGYEDGGFHPDAPITRAEAAVAVNRAVGRDADAKFIDAEIIIPLYSDLTRDHWAFYDMMEAALGHTQIPGDDGTEQWTRTDAAQPQYPEGPVFVGLDLYYVGADGRPARLRMVGDKYFGADGRYSSGDREIDWYVHAVLSEILAPGMSREEMLRAAYDYTRDSFTYLKRHYYKIGDTGWTREEGKTMFSTGLGNCYCYTSVFYYLARQLGYDAVAVSGVVGHDRSPHGWVEIAFDGVDYIFDTELEMAYRAKGIMSYNFFMMPYSRIPWPYVK